MDCMAAQSTHKKKRTDMSDMEDVPLLHGSTVLVKSFTGKIRKRANGIDRRLPAPRMVSDRDLMVAIQISIVDKTRDEASSFGFGLRQYAGLRLLC
jgi:hypothetical protein